MSYHVQQNTQQRSVGIFIVIAFHVLLIWALANGLGRGIINILSLPDPIKLAPIDKPITPPQIVHPQQPTLKNPTHIVIKPTELSPIEFESTQPPLVVGSGDESTLTTTSLSKPKLLKASKPEYPSAASLLGEEGATSLKLLIGTDGRVVDALLVTSSGSSRLDEAAIKHAKRNWVFSPCTEGSNAVACWHQTKLVWQLKDAGR